MNSKVVVVLSIVFYCMCPVFSSLAQQSAPAATNITSSATNVVDLAKALDRQLDLLESMAGGVDEAGKPLVDPGYKQSVLQSINRLSGTIEDKDYRNSVQIVDAMSSFPGTSEFRQAMKEFSATLKALLKADQVAFLNETKAIVTGLSAACAKASTDDDFQEIVDKIQQAQAGLNRGYSNYDSPAMNMLREQLNGAQGTLREWMMVRAAMASGDESRALESISRLESMSIGSGVAELEKLRTSLASAVNERIEKTILTAREAMLKATSVKEVQAASKEFNRQCDRFRRSSYGDSYMQQSIEGLKNALASWTRIIAAEAKGDFSAALQNLNSMENDYNSRNDSDLQALVLAKKESLVKRLLAEPRKEDDPMINAVNEIVTKAATIDELVALKGKLAALQQYASMRSSMTGQNEIQGLVGDISALESSATAFKARQYTYFLQPQFAGMGGYGTHRWKQKISGFQANLRLQALAEMFEIKDLQIKGDEPIDKVFLNAADQSVRDKQWSRLAKCLDAYRVTMFGNQQASATLMAQIEACQKFVAAQNLEAAGDLERAAMSYLQVLSAPQERTPVAQAITEIARLRKDHPEVFERLKDVPMPMPRPAPDQGRNQPAGIPVRPISPNWVE